MTVAIQAPGIPWHRVMEFQGQEMWERGLGLPKEKLKRIFAHAFVSQFEDTKSFPKMANETFQFVGEMAGSPHLP
jgi:hypothetical protein